ncbi:tetratricopeptide repeat protein [Falsirhodobacter sp. 20TX0035]|uniref:tetratricopeptide repeat protein n=1 Tax=Falsirhodobacter sp. 20TX0035 TaxID=3022019 RepID=UPI00232C3FAA|nr:tetratricopeptide repeat protein [Falsirhodobacter sp. 20TX0035]MDB6454415.1 tetratricopeptide repeat protein [Falsirhodobacter sp. 20TX0035]
MRPVLALTALPLILAACASPDGTRPATGEEAKMIRLAQDIQARGDAATAAGLYAQAAQQSTDPVGANIRLGEALMAAGDPEGAARPFRTALNADPDNGAALLGLGTAQLRADQVQGAARTLAVAAPKVRSGTAYNRLGTALILSGDTAGAEAAFRNAAGLEPANLDTQSNIALAEAVAGRNAEAVATARAVTTSPRSELRHFRNLMLVLMMGGQDTAAAAVQVPDWPEAEKRAFLTEARKIRGIPTAAGKARAIGLLAAG